MEFQQLRLAGRANGSVQDLATSRWVMLSDQSVQRAFASLFERNGLEASTPLIKTDSVALIQRLTSRSDVLAVLPHEAVERQLEQGAISVYAKSSLMRATQSVIPSSQAAE